MRRSMRGWWWRLTLFAGLACVGLGAEASGYRVLYDFASGPPGPSMPATGPVLDGRGTLIGSTNLGGRDGTGTIYRFTLPGTMTVLASLPSRTSTTAPQTMAADGTIYVPSSEGPPVSPTHAALFVLPPGGTGFYIPIPPGASGAVQADPAGRLEGPTSGSVYTVSLPSRTSAVLQFFPDGSPTSADSIEPGNLAMDAAGNVFGGSYGGGTAGLGTVFKLSPSGVETILYNFPDPFGCTAPNSGMALDAAGNLYGGTTNFRQPYVPGACLFKLAPSGVYTILHQFDPLREGSDINGGLVIDRQGNLFGTNREGGPLGGGTLFEVAPNGKLTILYAFAAHKTAKGYYEGADGFAPNAGLAMDAAGDLYGTTAGGGKVGANGASYGVLFEYSP